jgi:hypothetical protein
MEIVLVELLQLGHLPLQLHLERQLVWLEQLPTPHQL